MRRILSVVIAADILSLVLSLVACPFLSDPTPDPDPLPELETRVETRFERFVERYDTDTGLPVEQWVYDGSGVLTENLVYTIDTSDRIVFVAVYSSATVHNTTTKTADINYEYDGSTGNIVGGELWKAGTTGLELSARYTASYVQPYADGPWFYTDFLLTDGTDAVIEHRVCTYNPDGTYAEESYYRDAGTADLKERYTPVYSGTPARAVQETHYLRIPAADGVGEDYETTMINIFSYNGDDLYLQSTYAENDPGTLKSALLYTFADVGPASASYREKRTRSVLNADGQVMLYRSYTYDPDGYAVGVSYFDYTALDGEELKSREAFSYYQDDAGNYYYEASSYTYDYPVAAASGRTQASMSISGPSVQNRFTVPVPAHFGE